MAKKRCAMTLMEMVICLAIIAVCLVALVRVSGNVPLFSMRQGEDALLVKKTEALIVTLEAAPPEEASGRLAGPWHYRTFIEGEHYVLEVWHEGNGEQHEFLLRKGPL